MGAEGIGPSASFLSGMRSTTELRARILNYFYNKQKSPVLQILNRTLNLSNFKKCAVKLFETAGFFGYFPFIKRTRDFKIRMRGTFFYIFFSFSNPIFYS